MGNRKQPFGYRMEMGCVVIHPQEAEIVQYVFQQYIAGASFSALVNALSAQDISYDQDKSWNKNMVARILADQRYTGENEYPAIISQADMDTALKIRTSRQVPIQKTAAQKVIRQLSGHTATHSTEQQVLDLLNSLIGRPEKLHIQPVQVANDTCFEFKAQLDKIIAIQPVDEDSARDLVFKLAAARYDQIGSAEYETERLKRIFAAAEPMETLDAEPLKSTVAAIHIQGNGAICLELKNHQMIAR